MDGMKTVIHVSHDVPYSRAEFFTTLESFSENKIEVIKVCRATQEIWTKHVYIRFLTRHSNFCGLSVDELFGIRNYFNEIYLKDRTKPRFSGSIADYVKKIEENATNDAFLKQELDKIRKE